MLGELKGESQGTGVLKTERNLPDQEGRKGNFYGEVLASESWHQEKDLMTKEVGEAGK